MQARRTACKPGGVLLEAGRIAAARMEQMEANWESHVRGPLRPGSSCPEAQPHQSCNTRQVTITTSSHQNVKPPHPLLKKTRVCMTHFGKFLSNIIKTQVLVLKGIKFSYQEIFLNPAAQRVTAYSERLPGHKEVRQPRFYPG